VWQSAFVMMRPQLVNRVANPLPGVAATVLGFAALAPESGWWVAGSVLIPVGALVAVRGYRLGVETHQASVQVRGMLRTRSIPRGAIQQITDCPAIAWTDTTGRARWTPVTAFITPGRTLTPIASHHADCVKQLRKWARSR
jgi:hypothetical protein